jgi:hypothetical protein
MEFGRNLLLGDVLVMGWERISLKAERADPYSCPGINVSIDVRLCRVLEYEKREMIRTRMGSTLLDKAVCK